MKECDKRKRLYKQQNS